MASGTSMRSVHAAESLFMDSLVEHETRKSDEYLNDIAKNFPHRTVRCRVQKGSPADVIIEAVFPERGGLIAMADWQTRLGELRAANEMTARQARLRVRRNRESCLIG